MPETSLDLLRKACFERRISNSFGKFVHWSPDQLAALRDLIWSASEKTLRASYEKKFVRTKGPQQNPPSDVVGAAVATAPRKFLFRISSEDVDREDDTIACNGWNFANFASNSPVLLSHDSASMPVAQSSMPHQSANSILAYATFPAAGTSPRADEVCSMVAAGILRGASVGFRPLKWKLSTDPTRPMGIDFLAHELCEWSVVSVPANPSCTLIGASSGKSISAGSRATTRADRIAEAAAIRRSLLGRI